MIVAIKKDHQIIVGTRAVKKRSTNYKGKIVRCRNTCVDQTPKSFLEIVKVNVAWSNTMSETIVRVSKYKSITKTRQKRLRALCRNTKKEKAFKMNILCSQKSGNLSDKHCQNKD